MAIPARCNKRYCQARRNLPKRPELYARWPECHLCGEGKMYVDEYRLRRGPYDQVEKCTDLFCRVQHKGKQTKESHHNINLRGCTGYDAYHEHLALRGPVKNSPFPREADNLEEAPF